MSKYSGADPRASAFGAVADAVLAAECASDSGLAAAGRLLAEAVAGREQTGVPAPLAQRVLDDLEQVLAGQFSSRKALVAAHWKLQAMARTSARGGIAPWGPDSGCPHATAATSELRAVA